MTLIYKLGYQESISVYPTRRQIFAGKPYDFPQHLTITHIHLWSILCHAGPNIGLERKSWISGNWNSNRSPCIRQPPWPPPTSALLVWDTHCSYHMDRWGMFSHHQRASAASIPTQCNNNISKCTADGRVMCFSLSSQLPLYLEITYVENSSS